MRYIFLISLIICIKQTVFAQSTKHSLSLYAGPAISDEILTAKDKTEDTRVLVNYLNDFHKSRFTYVAGMNWQYQIKSKIKLVTGVDFRQLGFKTVSILHNTGGNPTSDTIPYSSENIRTYKQIGLKLGVSYSFFQIKRFSLSTGVDLGASYNFDPISKFIFTYTYGKEEVVKNKDLFPYKTLTMDAGINLSVNYSIGQRVQLFAEPFYWMSIVSVSKSATIGYRPTLWGVKLGTRYLF